MPSKSWALQQARIEGHSKYLGTPCKQCGNATRWTNNQGCVACSQAAARQKYKTEPRPRGRYAASQRYYQKHQERLRAYQRTVYAMYVKNGFRYRKVEGKRKWVLIEGINLG